MLHAPPIVDLRPYADTVTFEFPGGSFQQTSIYLAAWGAPLRLVASRGADGRVHFRQDTGGVERPLSVTARNFPNGIPAMVDIKLLRKNGTTAFHERSSLCPNFGGFFSFTSGERLDDANPGTPETPTFPANCGETFSKRVVEGIDRGWDVILPSDFFAPNGTYTLRVEVNPDRTLRESNYRNDVATAKVKIGDSGRVGAAPALRTQPTAPSFAAGPEGVFPPRSATLDAVRKAAAPGLEGRIKQALPDLAPLPAEQISPDRQSGRDLLTFASTIWNGGRGPVVVEGFRSSPTRMDAYQLFYGHGRLLGSRRAGDLVYDPQDGHHHWHYDGLARYRLLHEDGSAVQTSGKIGFCFGQVFPIDMRLPNAVFTPPPWLNTFCGHRFSPSTRMRLDVGWGDMYTQFVAGQAFDITDVPNGTYQIEITVNNGGRLLETTAANNRSLRTVILGGTPGHRTVTVPPVFGAGAQATRTEGEGAFRFPLKATGLLGR
jgi:hypothetical protein